MYRHPWEIAAIVRYHAAELASERQACMLLDRAEPGQPGLLARLRRRLGIRLITLGWALADDDVVTPQFSPAARTPAWGTHT